MKTIHKHILPLQPEITVTAPVGAKFLDIAEQFPDEPPRLWIEVYDHEPDVQYTIYMVRTGGDVPRNCRYLKSVHQDGGNFVFHYYTPNVGGLAA